MIRRFGITSPTLKNRRIIRHVRPLIQLFALDLLYVMLLRQRVLPPAFFGDVAVLGLC